MNTPNPNRGQFVVLEGPDGSGKTTQLKLLEQWLIAGGNEVVVAREPGGTKWGQEIRRIFLEGQGELVPMAEVMLLLAAKAQVLKEVVLPAYNAGKIVLMDRYNDSLLAYQGGGRQMGIQVLKKILSATELNFPPTLTIYMGTSIRTCMKRIAARSTDENNQIDALSKDYHRRVHAGYAQLVLDAQRESRPHLLINGEVDQLSMQIDIVSAVSRLPGVKFPQRSPVTTSPAPIALYREEPTA